MWVQFAGINEGVSTCVRWLHARIAVGARARKNSFLFLFLLGLRVP